MKSTPKWMTILEHPILFLYLYIAYKILREIEVHYMRKEKPKVKE